ncbi:Lrp/AsnC family transcriptional regulator [Chitinivorax sp. B]|uniref:siroheme decarboxylase subunit beta n=1 Tax=Chitinivorax sp. B TaxID=2502235 RepID=UPI0010F53D19|nr:Lrp/AsnC family transcriptional regulator [Chitinivorax sp. B]
MGICLESAIKFDHQHWHFQLLNDYQRDLPVVPKPFQIMADELSVSEPQVLNTLQHWQDTQVVSRVGTVFQPNTVGYSTLAAMAVPNTRLDATAALVSARLEVNHNYQREHVFNLWFVVTTPTIEQRETVLTELAATCNLPLISLPLVQDYHIDLGFDLQHGTTPHRNQPSRRVHPTPLQRHLLRIMRNGLPLVSRPFAQLGRQIDQSEPWVMRQINDWLDNGAIRRMGLIVRHHELGFTANAMAVWDIPDERVHAIGQQLAMEPGVNLCYLRQRALPAWPYNLFCMIHGRHRLAVEARLATLNNQLGLAHYPQTVLFSVKRFKQCGACYG